LSAELWPANGRQDGQQPEREQSGEDRAPGRSEHPPEKSDLDADLLAWPHNIRIGVPELTHDARRTLGAAAYASLERAR
jgi:hypothetical protein